MYSMLEIISCSQILYIHARISNSNYLKCTCIHIAYTNFAGHCSDSKTSSPTPGLQFILGTREHPELFDTIVMANLVS